jgi:hypothetical protein
MACAKKTPKIHRWKEWEHPLADAYMGRGTSTSLLSFVLDNRHSAAIHDVTITVL